MRSIRMVPWAGMMMVCCALLCPRSVRAEQSERTKASTPANPSEKQVYVGIVTETSDGVHIELAIQGALDYGTPSGIPQNIPVGLVAVRALSAVIKSHPKALHFHMEWSIRSGPL